MNKIAIYPGTFDPVTNGHMDLIERGCRIFDEVVIAISSNPRKRPLFDQKERIRLMSEVTKGYDQVKVLGFDELLVDFARKQKARSIIRGLRAVSDFEFEFQLASANRRLDEKIETVFLTPSEANNFTSSSLVREIARYGGDVSSFVDPVVKQALEKKFAQDMAG